jgi:hypothetical protein
MPGSSDERSLGQVSAKLARRWATQRLSAVQAYGRILSDYGSGRSSGSAAAGAYAKLVAEETVRYSADAIGVAADLATALVRQAGGARQPPSSPQRPIQDLEISGPLGDIASAEFVLRNPHDQPVSLSFAASNFTSEKGETKGTVTIEPAQLVLAAGGEQAISVMAMLDPEIFSAGGRYSANVAITGFDDLVVRVRLDVLPE